ncbi:MAG: YbaN family protein [Prolixibacteraceae bacterium]|nr:YbaN family protein [Prolixibacteraceae bacterium]
MILKYILIILGTLSLGLGILGIFIPGLPTTPFLLLTAMLYVRSSPRLYEWLISNKYLGKYIRNFRKRKGMTISQKIYALVLMWAMILLSVFLLLKTQQVKVIVLIVGFIGTVVMGFIVKTAKLNADDTDQAINHK